MTKRGLRNALLEGVLDPHVYALDILRLWEIAADPGTIYVYQRIDGSLLRFSIAGTSDQLERNDLLFVGVGNTFVDVQRLLVLGTDLVDETVHIVSGRRNNVRVATLVYDPTPLAKHPNPNVLIIGAAAVHLFDPYITPVTKVEGLFGLCVVGHVGGTRRAARVSKRGSLLFRPPSCASSLSHSLFVSIRTRTTPTMVAQAIVLSSWPLCRKSNGVVSSFLSALTSSTGIDDSHFLSS